MNFMLIYFLTCLNFCSKVHLENPKFVKNVLQNNKLFIKPHIKHNVQKYVKNNENNVNAQDHALTFLTKRTIESCPFGFLPSPTNASDCKLVLCHSDFDCKTNFGSNTMCRRFYHSSAKFCQCDNTHSLDTENRCTVEVGNPFDHRCSATAECENWVPNSVCINGRCKCDLGYAVTGASGAKCEQVFCNASTPAQQGRAVCREHFGENVQCNLGNECSCDPYINYDFETRTGCRPTVSPLGGACTSDRNCSSICLNGRCGCKFGSIEDPSYSRYLCNEVRCTGNDQCRRHWPHSRCYHGNGGVCVCDDSYERNRSSSSQSCVPKYRLLGAACQADGDCGREARCLRHSCTCPAGARPRENQMDCQAISCRTDGECQQFGDANLVCQSSGGGGGGGSGGGCVCRNGYFVNLAKCTRHIGNSDGRSELSLTTFVFLIVLFLAVFG